MEKMFGEKHRARSRERAGEGSWRTFAPEVLYLWVNIESPQKFHTGSVVGTIPYQVKTIGLHLGLWVQKTEVS